MTTDLQAPHDLEDRLQHFQNLMPHRVGSILLVASPYDSFVLEEEGRLDELILSESAEQNLRNVPGITRVTTGSEALAVCRKTPPDLLLSTLHIGDMPWPRLAREVKGVCPDLPLALLAFDDRELAEIRSPRVQGTYDHLYAWHGDFRILLAIVKTIEDQWNVEEDVALAGVGVIILIEDSVRYYSSFLPHLYTELVKQSERVIAEGVNLTHKIMRMRARPKILLSTSYEEAEAAYRKYQGVLLGIISDVDFPRGGKPHAYTGLEFARMVRMDYPDVPILLQTRDPAYADRAREVQAACVLKDSPFLLRELREFMLQNFGFGAFVFRSEDGTELGRAENLHDMERVLHEVPDDVIRDHASRNHFSTWLRARTEFRLAEELRRRKVSDFPSAADLRIYLIESIREFRRERQSGVISAFRKDAFDPQVGFAKIGGGSMGGKARGLAFARELLYNYRVRNRFPGVRIVVPAAVTLGTDVFDQFLDENDLRDFAIREEHDSAIDHAFLQARFPKRVLAELFDFLDDAPYPLAVRSSSLLEDSPYQPFAGIYRTVMVPNNHPNPRVRRRDLVRAIKRVYASTFSSKAKTYLRATTFRLEEEKMAVIVQRLGGARHGHRFYPEISGVARSYNFYPMSPLRAEDGVVSLALGLGKTVVEGGKAFRFSPRHPQLPVDFASTADLLEAAQTTFYCLDLTRTGDAEEALVHLGLDAAQEDDTLGTVASVYSPENDAVYDGLSRPGIPFVTMAPVLKHGVFPLSEALRLLLEIGERGMNTPVEVEFAVDLSPPSGEAKELLFLQMRPMVVSREAVDVHLEEVEDRAVLCRSGRVLGNGRIDGIQNLVVVDREHFDPARSADVAREVARIAAGLTGEVPYLLIGAGRWGSSEPWLGIPVTWEEIAGARAIVEANLPGKHVAPSQGSHFFHNLTASLTAYFTVETEEDGFVDWAWLRQQRAVEEGAFVRHLRLPGPVTVIADGRTGRGVILKPSG
jgi:pyruvate phosphate dikinase-like enzyme